MLLYAVLSIIQFGSGQIIKIPEGTVRIDLNFKECRFLRKFCLQNRKTSQDFCDKKATWICKEKPSIAKIKSFYIDKTEVSIEKYLDCVQKSKCIPLKLISCTDIYQNPINKQLFPYLNPKELPISCVSQNDARQFCRSQGGRLPTKIEWIYVARGLKNKIFPCKKNILNSNVSGPYSFYEKHTPVNKKYSDYVISVNTLSKCKGPFGTLNQGGNVYEWVSDPDIIMGGSFSSSVFSTISTHYEYALEDTRSIEVGFRCAYDSSNIKLP